MTGSSGKRELACEACRLRSPQTLSSMAEHMDVVVSVAVRACGLVSSHLHAWPSRSQAASPSAQAPPRARDVEQFAVSLLFPRPVLKRRGTSWTTVAAARGVLLFAHSC